MRGRIVYHIVKKYKKLAKNFGLTNIFGSEFLVSPLEYKEYIESLIRQSLKTKCYNNAKILVSLLNFQIHKI